MGPRLRSILVRILAVLVSYRLSYLSRSTLGISRVFFHQGIGYKSNFLQPVTLTRSPSDGSPLPSPLLPHVSPQYYAAIVAAEAIGFTNDTRISELQVDDDRVAAYLIYEGDTPVRAVFINTEVYLPSAYGIFRVRPVVHVRLNVHGASVYEMKRLTIPYVLPPFIAPKHRLIPDEQCRYSDSTLGLSWGGVTYETPNGRPSGEEIVECVDPEEGFALYATEAILAYLA